MVVWGGSSLVNGTVYPLSSGGRYRPNENHWNKPAFDVGDFAGPFSFMYPKATIWTGSQMLVWPWGRFDPVANKWMGISDYAECCGSSPRLEDSSSAVWTGTEMILWGGFNPSVSFDQSTRGLRYNPATDEWKSISSLNSPQDRWNHEAVWTGSDMIVWGGNVGTFEDGVQPQNTGKRYNLSTDTWSLIWGVTTEGAPPPLDLFSAFWTGAEMIIFDGFQHVGGLYNPSMDRWISMSVPNPVPAPRSGYSAVWTGEDLIVWGGISDELGSSRFKNEGWRYSPRGNHWTELPLQGAPSPRRDAAAVWTGSEMIVWGGRGWGVDQTVQLDTGGVYNLSSDTWRATDSANAPPPSGYGLSAVWTGSEMLVLGDWGYTVWSYRPGRVMYLYTSP